MDGQRISHRLVFIKELLTEYDEGQWKGMSGDGMGGTHSFNDVNV